MEARYGDSYPLTHQQLRVWRFEQRHPSTSAYNLCGCLVLQARIDLDLIERTVDTVFRLNQGLRLVYTVQEGEPRQHVAPFREHTVERLDFSGAADPRAAFERWAREQYAAPFQLEECLLYHFAIARLTAESCAFFCKLHHLNADAWTYALFDRQFSSIMSRMSAGIAVADPPNPSYLEYVEAEKSYLCSAAAEEDRAFWRGMFACGTARGSAATPPAPTTRRSRTVRRRMGDDITGGLEALTQQHDISAAVFFLGVVSLYFAGADEQGAVVVETSTENRSRGRFRETMGFFANVIKLRVAYDDRASGLELLLDVKHRLAACLKHQRYPIDLLEEEIARDGGDDTPPALFFNYYSLPAGSRFGADGEIIELFSPWIMELLQVVVRPAADGGGYEVVYRYAEEELDAAQVDSLHEALTALAAALLREPSAPVGASRRVHLRRGRGCG